jgi:signal transduction histidine kinase
VLERLPIRWRLAGISALLTCVILSAFAVVIGEVTTRRVRSDFRNQLVAAADDLSQRLNIVVTGSFSAPQVSPSLDLYAGPEHAAIRIVDLTGGTLDETRDAPDFGFPSLTTQTVGDYLVASRSVQLARCPTCLSGSVFVQYGRRLSDLEATVHRVRAFLIFGVLAGTALALGGGLVLARRAMKPVADLTSISMEITRTRDPNQRVPIPRSDDEVTELARTLDTMLRSLESARAETSSALKRQREFVADASHELRTPLTSVYANLELLSETLHGDERDAARSALRSTRRMKRLVGDLLLLARADAQREVVRERVDLSRVLVDAAAELGPVSEGHELVVDAEAPATVLGAPDELHRLVLNLMQNAVEHTPAGTRVEASVRRERGDVLLTVADDGPGIDPAIRDRLFERFVSAAGDRGGSTGLGLAIVKAVAEGHGGTVTVEDHPLLGAGRGTRFTVRLPATAAPAPAPAGRVA